MALNSADPSKALSNTGGSTVGDLDTKKKKIRYIINI